MSGSLVRLLQDVGVPAAILAALVGAALVGYGLAVLRAILKEIREIKAQFREVKAQFREVKEEIREVKAQAQEDRRVNKADHDRLFQAVADLKAVVEVLRDRSDRPGG